jgi:hypothetical protein
MVIFIKFFLSLMVFENLQYLFKKERLICLSHWNFANDGASCHVFGVVGKFSMNKGVSNWFHNVLTYSEEVIENNFFIENSLK